MKIEDFFKEINNGKLRGAQAKMARDLNTSTATTSEKEKPIQQNFKNKDCHIQQVIGNFEAELIKEKLKSLDAKLDLLIQLVKGGK